jgi:(4S)-4-hydroxy-5-phosphonooxypentane-2,3-dione isomerase
MVVVHVHVQVKPERVDEFIEATVENASNSLQEHGVTRFDVLQQQDEPTRFILTEVYRTPEDAARHKETEHYQVWRDAVAEMMAAPRSSVKFDNVFPSASVVIQARQLMEAARPAASVVTIRRQCESASAVCVK